MIDGGVPQKFPEFHQLPREWLLPFLQLGASSRCAGLERPRAFLQVSFDTEKTSIQSHDAG